VVKLAIATAACLLLLTPFARAAEMSDSDLVKRCVEELKSRQPSNEVQENTELVASHIERTERQQVVDVQVTEAEGRRVAGRCIIRNGKVFDYKG
jgi:hypothetical protein